MDKSSLDIRNLILKVDAFQTVRIPADVLNEEGDKLFQEVIDYITSNLKEVSKHVELPCGIEIEEPYYLTEDDVWVVHGKLLWYENRGQ